MATVLYLTPPDVDGGSQWKKKREGPLRELRANSHLGVKSGTQQQLMGSRSKQREAQANVLNPTPILQLMQTSTGGNSFRLQEHQAPMCAPLTLIVQHI